MLELRPNCECCDKDLPPDATDAMICTFECTFCADCAEDVLGGVCPNCGGNFSPRPIRPAAMLAKHPASTKRVLKAEGCAPPQGRVNPIPHDRKEHAHDQTPRLAAAILARRSAAPAFAHLDPLEHGSLRGRPVASAVRPRPRAGHAGGRPVGGAPRRQGQSARLAGAGGLRRRHGARLRAGAGRAWRCPSSSRRSLASVVVLGLLALVAPAGAGRWPAWSLVGLLRASSTATRMAANWARPMRLVFGIGFAVSTALLHACRHRPWPAGLGSPAGAHRRPLHGRRRPPLAGLVAGGRSLTDDPRRSHHRRRHDRAQQGPADGHAESRQHRRPADPGRQPLPFLRDQ